MNFTKGGSNRVKEELWIYKVWGAIAYAIVGVWARIPYAEQTLLIFMGIDLVVGMIAHILSGTFRAKELFLGILKKIGTWFLLLMMHRLEVPGVQVDFDKWTAYFLCFYEVLSVVENYSKFGKVPPPITRAIEGMRDILHKTFGAEKTDQ